MSYCKTHNYAYHDLPIDECPICVREERDRLRVIVKGLEEETTDKTMWRDEAMRMRDLIPQAWEAGIKRWSWYEHRHLPQPPTLGDWMKQKGLA